MLKRALSGAAYVSILWVCTYYSETSFRILFACLGITCVYEIWKIREGKTKIIPFLYVLIPFVLIHTFGAEEGNTLFSRSFILFIFILTWVFDTFAYLTGITFGKHKILPSISPKKSWEGFAGGSIFTIITAYLITKYFPEIDINKIITISILLPFTATLGDFTASYYKRQAGVKDSGNIIPGHGGMLDRMDAFMFTIPMLYVYLKLDQIQ